MDCLCLMTLDTKRISTVHPITGAPQLVISKPGEDADLLGPQNYEKLEYHSKWDSVESVVRADEVEWSNLGPYFSSHSRYYAPTVRIDFPDLGFPPIVDFDLVQVGSHIMSGVNWPGVGNNINVDLIGMGHAEEWNKISTGGDDPYLKRIFCHSFTDHITFTPSGSLDDFTNENHYRLSFIIWNLPAR